MTQCSIQSDLAYPVLFYPHPSPSGRKSLVTDLQHMPCIHAVCVFDYPVPSPIRMFLLKTDVMCAVMRGLTVHTLSYVAVVHGETSMSLGFAGLWAEHHGT